MNESNESYHAHLRHDSDVWSDKFIHVTWPISIFDLTHTRHIHVCVLVDTYAFSLTHVCFSKHICICQYVFLNTFVCVHVLFITFVCVLVFSSTTLCMSMRFPQHICICQCGFLNTFACVMYMSNQRYEWVWNHSFTRVTQPTTVDAFSRQLIQPIAFGVSFNLNFIGLFSTERGKRDRENQNIDWDLSLKKWHSKCNRLYITKVDTFIWRSYRWLDTWSVYVTETVDMGWLRLVDSLKL